MKTKTEKIIDRLCIYGEVSRNWALSIYYSRLGALINRLKKEGWSFDTERVGGDYLYIARIIPDSIKRPLQETLKI